MWLNIYPDKALYRPGETVPLVVEVIAQTETDVHLVAAIAFLSDEVARLTQTIHLLAGETTTVELAWTPPVTAPRGYGVDLRVLDDAGQVLATASTAFDVLERWSQAPRYGFLTDFDPGRADFDQTMLWLTRYHVNGLQFYDWMYRHQQLLPPTEVFDDALGRRLSLTTVAKLIEAAHARGIAVMPYTAIYAAAVPFFYQNPNWALLDEDGHPIPFGDDFLMIMNPAADSLWTGHLQDQFAQVLERTAFDGIHLDQYGEPKVAHDADGNRLELAAVIPEFINLTKETAGKVRPDATVVFNCVNDWPIETVARTRQDFVYIEVWPPHTLYRDLHTLIVKAQALSGGKPVVLAVYIDPAHARNVRLANAVIFASGGYHIELGEPGGMLADPYFPKYGDMGDKLALVLQRYYDFGVRYENVLALDTHDATPAYAGKVSVEGINTDAGRAYNKIWPIVRENDDTIALSLINLLGLESPEWNSLLLADPPCQEDLVLRFYTECSPGRVWWATPDDDNLAVRELEFSIEQDKGEIYVTFCIPRLSWWDLIVLDKRVL
ncbi:MAG: glycoside hydrolase family 66 protein [Chloroflexota bacterium]|nr:glycoside hydrolase family 66 protein [Chloroflexota bacterium]